MRKQKWLPIGLGVLTFAVYVAAPQRVHSDSIWVVPTALSLVLRGDLDLDEYRPACARVQHGCSEVNGHLYSDFPVAPALIAAGGLGVFEAGLWVVRPAVMHVPALARQVTRWETHRDALGDIDLQFFDVTENLLAAGCVSLAVVLFFLALRRRLLGDGTALVLAATLAFGTSAFSTASRVMWQHGPAMACCCGALLLLLRPATRAGLLGLGVVLAAGWLCRPTMSVFGALVVALLALTRRRDLPLVLLGAALVVGAFLALNERLFAQLLPAYFVAGRLDPLSGQLGTALAGNLVSPSRGLFVFTPLAVLVPVGLFVALRRRGAWFPLEVMLATWLVMHWLIISTFPHWWGGHSFGPRFWTETSPALVWLLVPLFEPGAVRSRVALGVFVVLASLGVAIHTRGATSLVPWKWNDEPVNVDEAPARLWDWRDPQFLRVTQPAA